MIIVDEDVSHKICDNDDYFYGLIYCIYDSAQGIFEFANISTKDFFKHINWTKGKIKGEFPYETCEVSSNLEQFLRKCLGIVERINSQNLTNEQRENDLTIQYFNKLIDDINYTYNGNDSKFELINNNGVLSLKFTVLHFKTVCDIETLNNELDKVTTDEELDQLIIRTMSKNYTGSSDDINEYGCIHNCTDVIFDSIKSTDKNENVLTLLYDCFIKPNL